MRVADEADHLYHIADLKDVLGGGKPRDMAQKKKIAWVNRLATKGADVNYMNEYGNEAFHAASFKNLPEIEAFLIKNGARALTLRASMFS